MNRTALITGASSGIGLSLAKVFAKNNYDLVIVARRPEELATAAADLQREFPVKVTIFATDLTKPTAPQQVFDFCRSQNLTIEVLINNAGFGLYGKFGEANLEQQLGLIDLNVRSLTALTGLFLPGMIAAGRGKILNTASTAAFQPGPLMAAYYASKAFVLSFSEALNNELKGSGINVTALCPGGTKTNFQNLTKGFGDINLLKRGHLMSADLVAEVGFQALMDGQAVVIPGFNNKLLAFATRLGPRNLVTAISRWTLEKS